MPASKEREFCVELLAPSVTLWINIVVPAPFKPAVSLLGLANPNRSTRVDETERWTVLHLAAGQRFELGPEPQIERGHYDVQHGALRYCHVTLREEQESKAAKGSITSPSV